MGTIFENVAAMSWSACWLILAAVVLRWILRRAPKWTRGILWALVALRLICPLAVESPLSLLPEAGTQAVQQLSAPTERENQIPAADPEQETVLPEAASLPWVAALAWVWAGVGAGLLGYGLFRFLALRRSLAEAVRLRGNLYLSDRVGTPFVLGLFRPKIYLPAGLEPWMEEPVLAHEQAHISRGDPWWKALGYVLLCLHWFNPLVWLAYHLMSRDLELACDEKVVRDRTLAQRKTYAKALVACSLEKRAVLVCPLAFGEGEGKARVKAILSYRKQTPWLAAAAILACGLAAVCFLTDPVTATQGHYLILSADESALVLDEAEWVTQESRAEELGVTQDFQNGGFYLYDPAVEPVQYPLARNCAFRLTGDTQVEKGEFLRTVADRAQQGLGDTIPYVVTLEKGKITSVTEQYIP